MTAAAIAAGVLVLAVAAVAAAQLLRSTGQHADRLPQLPCEDGREHVQAAPWPRLTAEPPVTRYNRLKVTPDPSAASTGPRVSPAAFLTAVHVQRFYDQAERAIAAQLPASWHYPGTEVSDTTALVLLP